MNEWFANVENKFQDDEVKEEKFTRQNDSPCYTITVLMMIKKSFTFMALLNTFSNNFEKVIFNTSCHYKMTKSMDKL